MNHRRVFFALIFSSALSLSATTLYVAPNGNNAWSGRLPTPNELKSDGPLASLVGARNAIRQLTDRSQPITVEIADGRYQQLEPLLLEPQDSGKAKASIRYQAAPNAKPIFSGGINLTAWQVTPEGLWRTVLPKTIKTEQLWVNGVRTTPAQHGQGKLLFVQRVDEAIGTPDQPTIEVLKKFKVAPAKQSVFVKPAELAGLERLSAEEVSQARIMIFHKWNASPRRLKSIDVASGRIGVEGGAMQDWSNWRAKNSKLKIENVATGLDMPGSWLLSGDGSILYRPRAGETPEKTEAIVAVADKFVLMLGAPGEGNFVEHLTFSGLTFAHSRWLQPVGAISDNGGIDDLQAAAHIDAVITGDGVRDVSFDRCEISHVSRNAFWFRRGCSLITIERCEFNDLGAGAVRIGDYLQPRYPFERTRGCVVRNCRITGGGRIFPSATGIVIMQADTNHVAHNEIHDFYYSGISVGWTWGYLPTSASDNVVEFNKVSKIGQDLLSDMAGIYFLGPGHGNICRNNVVTDVTCHAYGGWGIYADEGSTGVLYENNLIVGTQSGGFHQNYGNGNVVRNNIFAYGQDMQVTRPRKEDHLSYTFERNIVIWDRGQFAGGRSVAESGKVQFENNLYHATGLADTAFTKELAERRAGGLDASSQVADPLFVDLKNGDFRLRPESPATKMGFVQFDYTQAGIQPN